MVTAHGKCTTYPFWSLYLCQPDVFCDGLLSKVFSTGLQYKIVRSQQYILYIYCKAECRFCGLYPVYSSDCTMPWSRFSVGYLISSGEKSIWQKKYRFLGFFQVSSPLSISRQLRTEYYFHYWCEKSCDIDITAMNTCKLTLIINKNNYLNGLRFLRKG